MERILPSPRLFWLLACACLLTACSLPGGPSPASTAVPLPVGQNHADSEPGLTPALPTISLPVPPVQTGLPAEPTPPGSTPMPPTVLPPSPVRRLEPLDRSRYEISARLEYAAHRLEVVQTIRYMNTTGVNLSELALVVEPNRFPGTFILSGLTWNGGQSLTGYSLEGNYLKVPLPAPLSAGERMDLSLAYRLDLPPLIHGDLVTRPHPLGYSYRQTNLVDWYVFVPPYQPEHGWLVHPPGDVGEHLAYELADFEIEIDVQPDPGQEVILAASAPGQADGSRQRYSLEAGRNFAWSASHSYEVLTTTVGTTTVSSYFFPRGALGGKAALERTAQALAVYQDLFGPYRRSSLSVIEADFLDGMEYEGLYFLSQGFYSNYDGSAQNFLTIIAVHETAHQWWYGQVGSDQALDPWLDEALCTYSERLFYERTYPHLVDWWWDYRVNAYQPEGLVGQPIYNFDAFWAYRNAVYLRGALFLESLRQTIGDEAFFAFLRAYAEGGRSSPSLAEPAGFYQTLLQFTKADLSGITSEYFGSGYFTPEPDSH